MSTSHILLIRHGQSTWNADGRWQGRADAPLSTLGVRQAHEAAEQLGTFDLIAASNLERASVTATIIANHLGLGPIVIDPDLAERSAGEFEGLTRDEIEAQFPGLLPDGRPPSFETDESVIERAVGALARIAADVGDGGTALVVSHGGVIYALERLLGLTRAERLANLGGRWFRVGPGEFAGGDEVLLVTGDDITIPGQI